MTGRAVPVQKRSRILRVLLRLAVCACLASASAWATCPVSPVPSGCTDISDIPVTYEISYNAAIQGLFDNFLTNGGQFGCVDCHTNPASGATGHLDLTDGLSWSHLIGITAYDDPTHKLKYVVPNHPEKSLLFQKLNCDCPALGNRMPSGFPSDTLSPEEQALIFDWIAGGAGGASSEAIFRGSFDPRGFAQ